MDQRLGRNVALASAYNLLHRHDWRKLAPDKRHPNPTQMRKISGKKLPDLIVEIDNAWEGEGPIRLMFMDEARFGRISDIRRSVEKNAISFADL